MRPALVVSALAVVVLTAGCGGQSSSEASFRTKANAACRNAAFDIKHVTGDSEQSVNKGLEFFRDTATRLARVQPPPRDAHTYHDLVARLKGDASFGRRTTPRSTGSTTGSAPS